MRTTRVYKRRISDGKEITLFTVKNELESRQFIKHMNAQLKALGETDLVFEIDYKGLDSQEKEMKESKLQLLTCFKVWYDKENHTWQSELIDQKIDLYTPTFLRNGYLANVDKVAHTDKFGITINESYGIVEFHTKLDEEIDIENDYNKRAIVAMKHKLGLDSYDDGFEKRHRYFGTYSGGGLTWDDDMNDCAPNVYWD